MIQPLNSPDCTLHQLPSNLSIIKTLPFLTLAKGFENLEGFLNKTLSVKGIIELTFFN